MKTLLVLLTFSLCSCALVTTPVKVVGKAATAAIGVTGKALGAGVSHLGKGE